MNKYFLLMGAAAIALVSANTANATDNADVTVDAEIAYVNDIEATETLDFGKLRIQRSRAFSYTIASDGSAPTATNAVQEENAGSGAGAYHPAIVEGYFDDVVNLQLPDSVTLTTTASGSGNGSITLDTFTKTLVPASNPASETDQIKIGGTISGAADAKYRAGEYTGTMHVTYVQ